MATLKKPKLLLLDEHTAALDPKTAAKVLEITDMIVNRDHLTTMMITHNMQDAINHGNRLIMMMEGKIILDIEGEEKKKLTVRNLLDQFEKASGQEFSNDAALFRIKDNKLLLQNQYWNSSSLFVFILFDPFHRKADTFFLHVDAQNTNVYHISYAYRLKGMLDIFSLISEI